MGGKSKKGAGSTYDYFGDLAMAVCRGPIDALQAVVVDGKTILSGPLSITAASTTWTSLDPGQEKYLGKGGRITLYRGTQTSPDAVLVGHPDYRGICYVVFQKLLFGRERTTAPNIQVIVSRRPVADTSLVAAEHNVLTALDGSSRPTLASQCNPVAVIVELLTSAHGLRIPVASMDATSWLAAAAWAADPVRITSTFCSPLLTNQADASQVLLDLLLMIDAVLYWTATGKLAIQLLEPGTTPGSLKTFDSRHWTSRPRITGPGWTAVPTAVALRFPDRGSQFKERVVKLDHLASLRHRGGIPQVTQIDRPHITSEDQAAAHAAEWLRRAAQPTGDIEIRVRRPLASGLHPGSKVLIDVDPEPGGSGLAQLCVIQEIRAGSTGPVTLRCRPDTLTTSTAYTPSWTVPMPQAPDCPPIDVAKCLVVPLRPGLTDPASVAILVPRPRGDVIGFRCFFGLDPEEDFADLGDHSGFAVRAGLGADIAYDASSAILTLPEGDTGPDAYLAERFPGTLIGAEADELLLVLAETDVDGRVLLDADDIPVCEICSISTRAAVGSDIVYTILRGRLGTLSRAWTSADAKGWIIPAGSWRSWTHPNLAALVPGTDTGYLRLVAYTAEAEDDTLPIPEIEFGLAAGYDLAPKITWTTPTTAGASVSGESYTVAFTITDRDGDLNHITLHAEQGGNIDVLAEYPVMPTASASYSASHQFATGTHLLVVTAKDVAGRVVSSSTVLTRTAGGSGDPLVPPSFNPPPKPLDWGLTVTMTCASPCDRIEWAIVGLGKPAPASGTLHMGTSKGITVTPLQRVWARSGNGTTWSAWVPADYPWAKAPYWIPGQPLKPG